MPQMFGACPNDSPTNARLTRRPGQPEQDWTEPDPADGRVVRTQGFATEASPRNVARKRGVRSGGPKVPGSSPGSPTAPQRFPPTAAWPLKPERDPESVYVASVLSRAVRLAEGIQVGRRVAGAGLGAATTALVGAAALAIGTGPAGAAPTTLFSSTTPAFTASAATVPAGMAGTAVPASTRGPSREARAPKSRRECRSHPGRCLSSSLRAVRVAAGTPAGTAAWAAAPVAAFPVAAGAVPPS